MVNESIVLSDVLKYKDYLNKMIVQFSGVDFVKVSKKKLLNKIGSQKEKLHSQLKRILKDETLSFSECLFVLMNWNGIIKPVCRSCYKKLRFRDITDGYVKKCDHCNEINDLVAEFNLIKLNKPIYNEIDKIAADVSLHTNSKPVVFTPKCNKPKTAGNTSELELRKMLKDKFKWGEFIYNKIYKHKTKNYSREIDIHITNLKLMAELHGYEHHHIDSKTVKQNLYYHVEKRLMASSLENSCIQLSSSFGSKRNAYICIRRIVEQSILLNPFLDIDVKTDPKHGLVLPFHMLSGDSVPVILDNIDPRKLEYESPVRHEGVQNFAEGFIYDSRYKIATLRFISNIKNNFPYCDNKFASMIQYRQHGDCVYIYKHYNYDNSVLEPEFNTLMHFKNFFIGKNGVTTVKYVGNYDYEHWLNFKFYCMPIDRAITKEEYLKNYKNYPIYNHIVKNAEPIYIIKSHVDIKYKNNNSYDHISEYSFETDPELKIPIDKHLKRVDGHYTIVNSGTFIITL